MNKYEKAIDIVARYCSDYRSGIFPPRHKSSKELDILMELVDKATPKKLEYEATGYYDGELVYDMAYCPICRHEFEYDINDWGCDYCSDCGQALDWSKE